MCGKERCVGRGDYPLIRHVKRVLVAQKLMIPYVCLGREQSLIITLSLCVRSGDRAPAKIKTPCVFVREGENKCLHSLKLRLCVWEGKTECLNSVCVKWISIVCTN